MSDQTNCPHVLVNVKNNPMNKANFKTYLNDIPKPDTVDNSIYKASPNLRNSPSSATTHLDTNNSNQDSPTPQPTNDLHDPEEVWKIVKENLRLHESKRNISVWYSDVYIEAITNGVATLSCKNHMQRDWIESYNRNFIKNKIEEVIGYKTDLMINVRQSNSQNQQIDSSSTTQETTTKEDRYEYYDPKTQGEQQALFGTTSTTDSTSDSSANSKSSTQTNLNPRYQITNFVVGGGNQLAYAVAEGVIQNPGVAYNPVFYYGPSGVGKTHLMQGIGNALIARNASCKVIYVPIETFMNDMIEAIRTRNNEEFRKKYRPADLLIIDDIQFISTYKKTQEELFNTFNALYQSNKQIIIASDRPPKEIDNLPDRLRTRFEGGMVVDIQPPDFETRLAILHQHMEESNVDLSNEIVQFIAEKVESNVRELEGSITKVATQMRVLGREITIEEVAKMLQVDLDSKRRMIKPEKIVNAVAEVFEVPAKDIKGKRRTAHIALARQTVMFLLREELELPLEQIAKQVNRKDHTTVIHACNKLEELIVDDERVKKRLDECKAIIYP